MTSKTMLKLAREWYWSANRSFSRWEKILSGESPEFREVVLADHLPLRSMVCPTAGETARRAAAAVKWLFNAQDATPDDGVSYGYFPIEKVPGWQVSYPETTGYIITSLIQYARRTGWTEAADRSHRMALWEASIQMPNGAVQGGKVTTHERQTPAAFNTGMVLDGFVSVLEERAEPIVLRAAEHAAEFLIGDMTAQGLFVTNGEFVSPDMVKIYNVLCAWALHRFGRLTGIRRYCDSAIKAVEGAVKFRNERGWFEHNCLSDPRRPLTHTIGYTMQGVIEVGIASEREDFVAAGEVCMQALIDNIQPNGFLAGRFDSSWRPAVRWSCLTGSAQIAISGYRLCKLRRDPVYGNAADRLVNFLKTTQRLNTGTAGIDGAVAGSFPIMADYLAAGYPSWATKYMLDALMLQADRSSERLDVAANTEPMGLASMV